MAAIIYSGPLCPYCEMAKKLLDQKEIPYKELTIGKTLQNKKHLRKLGCHLKPFLK